MSEAGIEIARRNINNFRYADDTTLMAESEEKLKSLLMKVKEESEKVGENKVDSGGTIRTEHSLKSWRRKWQPTPVFLPGKSHGQRWLAGCSPWGPQRDRHD